MQFTSKVTNLELNKSNEKRKSPMQNERILL